VDNQGRGQEQAPDHAWVYIKVYVLCKNSGSVGEKGKEARKGGTRRKKKSISGEGQVKECRHRNAHSKDALSFFGISGASGGKGKGSESKRSKGVRGPRLS